MHRKWRPIQVQTVWTLCRCPKSCVLKWLFWPEKSPRVSLYSSPRIFIIQSRKLLYFQRLKKIKSLYHWLQPNNKLSPNWKSCTFFFFFFLIIFNVSYKQKNCRLLVKIPTLMTLNPMRQLQNWWGFKSNLAESSGTHLIARINLAPLIVNSYRIHYQILFVSKTQQLLLFYYFVEKVQK